MNEESPSVVEVPDPMWISTAFCLFAAGLSIPWPSFSSVVALLAVLAEVALVARWRRIAPPPIRRDRLALLAGIGGTGWTEYIVGVVPLAEKSAILAASVFVVVWFGRPGRLSRGNR